MRLRGYGPAPEGMRPGPGAGRAAGGGMGGNSRPPTARKEKSCQWSALDRDHGVAALMAIEGELRQLRQAVREQGVREDT